MHHYQKRSRTAISCEVCNVCVSIRNIRCYWTQIGLRFCEQSAAAAVWRITAMSPVRKVIGKFTRTVAFQTQLCRLDVDTFLRLLSCLDILKITGHPTFCSGAKTMRSMVLDSEFLAILHYRFVSIRLHCCLLLHHRYLSIHIHWFLTIQTIDHHHCCYDCHFCCRVSLPAR